MCFMYSILKYTNNLCANIVTNLHLISALSFLMVLYEAIVVLRKIYLELKLVSSYSTMYSP